MPFQQLSRSLISIGNPIIAAALYGLAGLDGVIAVDLLTFAIAFVALLFFIKLPELHDGTNNDDNVIKLAKEGIRFLKETPLILTIILFMSGVNLTASVFDAVLPALVIPQKGNNVYGIITACSGVAMVAGSFLPMILPKPKDRVRVIYLTMLFSLGIENFLLGFSRSPVLWCVGQIVGWVFVPLMAANQNVIMRNVIPVELQGRVYACRNSLQFFTIPVGLFLGGFLVDKVCEPFMAAKSDSAFWTMLFGSGKGSGAALMMGILGVTGTVLCITSGQIMKKYKYSE